MSKKEREKTDVWRERIVNVDNEINDGRKKCEAEYVGRKEGRKAGKQEGINVQFVK